MHFAGMGMHRGALCVLLRRRAMRDANGMVSYDEMVDITRFDCEGSYDDSNNYEGQWMCMIIDYLHCADREPDELHMSFELF